jgi:hypothetical protein
MSSIQIPNLPAVIGLTGAELFEGVQAGTSVKISLDQIIAAVYGNDPIDFPIPVYLGGTGLSTFTVGDIMYASATQTLSKLADVATGNAIISGGVGVAPSYGKIGLTTHVDGVLPVANGGTNQSAALTQYGMIYGNTTTSMASTAAGTSTTLLHGNASGAPTWSAVSLTADVSGVLPVANGGTSVTSAPAEAARIMGYTSTATAGATTTLTNTSSQYQLFTGTLTQTITLPVTSTLTTGWTFHIVNNSTGNLTVNSSGGNLVCTVISGMTAMVTCIGTTLTTAADWEFGFTDFGSVTGTGSAVLSNSPALTGNVTVATNSASAAVTINQTGAGNAFVVEDSTSPDATPFVIDATGNVGIGTSAPGQLLNLYSATSAILQINGDATTSVTLDRASTDTSGPVLGWRKRRGTTASPLAVVSGDATGTMNYAAYDGSALQLTSQIINGVETFTGVNDVSGFITFSTRPTGAAAASTERMRIDASGNVGIGTSSPGSVLDVVGTNATDIFHVRNGTTYFAVGVTSGGASAVNAFQTGVGAQQLQFQTSGGASYFGGNVGIGTAAPINKLDVNGNLGLPAATTENRSIEIGGGRAGNGNSFIDLVGDATYTDFGLRILRADTGANANSQIIHRGTGGLFLTAQEATFISFQTTNVTRFVVGSAGQWGIGGGTYGTAGQAFVSGGAGAAPSWTSVGTFTTVTATTSVLSSGTGGVGYSTGAGVAVTQLTSRTTTTPTTGTSNCGAITVFTAAPVVGTYFSFTVPNTGIDITDTVVLTVRGGSNTYVANCSSISAGVSFRVTMVSVAGVASDTPIVNFAIIKGVSA